MKLASSTCSALTWLVLGSAAGGARGNNDGFEIVIREGDLVQGVGHITSMFDASVDDAGAWLLASETDGPFQQSRVLVLDGALMLQEGTALPTGNFDAAKYFVQLDAAGRAVTLIQHQLVPSFVPDAIYVGTQLLLNAGDPVGAPGVGAGSTYADLDAVTAGGLDSNGDGVALVLATIDDPTAPFPPQALVLVTYDGAANLLSEQIVMRSGTVPVGLSAPMGYLGSGLPVFLSVSSAGEAVYLGRLSLSTGSSCDYGIFRGATPLALEGWASPWGGLWPCNGGLQSSSVGFNDQGDYAFTGMEQGPSAVHRQALVVNGQPFARKDDVLAATHPHRLTSVGAGELSLDAEGNPLWFGSWDASGSGAFLGKTLLVELGVTRVQGELVVSWGSGSGMVDTSPNGDWVLLTAGLESGEDVLLRIDTRSVPRNYCTAGTSALGCRASITGVGTASSSAASGFELRTSGLGLGVSGVFFFGTGGRQANPWGNGTSYQCVAPPVRRLPVQTSSGITPPACAGGFALDLNTHWNVTKPGLDPGPGTLVQAQVWYRDSLNTSNQTTSLSDGVEFLVSP